MFPHPVVAPVCATQSSGMSEARTGQAVVLMEGFLQRTARTGQRYLWTDAFAVCNLLGLGRITGDARYIQSALQLVAGVHQTLGRRRPGKPDCGWLGDRSDADAQAHPTAAGLRIGKPLDERRPGEPSDAQREWDQDGQYFHYLTRWMHALDQTARATGEPRFARWAIELADAAHRAFTCLAPEGTGKRMYWKMSIDLSRPLVPSMGQHDPLDGLVMALELEATRQALAANAELAPGPSLAAAVADFAAMVERRGLMTSDALGLGGLMTDAARIHHLVVVDALPRDRALMLRLLDWLLEAAAGGLRRYLNEPDHRGPATGRLAFRELGLAIGLAAIADLHAQQRQGRFGGQDAGRAALQALAPELGTREEIESFWLDPAHQRAASWHEHLDINEVMLATALAPEGYLGVPTTSHIGAAAPGIDPPIRGR